VRVTVDLSRSRRWVTLGSRRFLIRRAGDRRVVVRLAPTALPKLRRTPRATLRVRVHARDRAGNSRVVSRGIVLRRSD
jgi:hypothetical protein